jgi:hypothetical protein
MLQVLSLASNRLTGGLDEFANSLTAWATGADKGLYSLLQRLNVSNNLLEGSVPYTLASSAVFAGVTIWQAYESGMTTLLRYMDLSNNQLNGEFPMWVAEAVSGPPAPHCYVVPRCQAGYHPMPQWLLLDTMGGGLPTSLQHALSVQVCQTCCPHLIVAVRRCLACWAHAAACWVCS